MRLMQNRIRTYYSRKKISKKDDEGSTYTEYGSPVKFKGEAWPAGGKIQTEMYGDRLSYIQNLRIDGKYIIKQDEKGVLHYIFEDGMDLVENDGICLFVSAETNPDYKIISIKPYRHLKLEVEKI